MKLLRNLSGAQLIKTLEKFGYQSKRQTGSHVRLTSLADVAAHHAMTREALITELFGK